MRKFEQGTLRFRLIFSIICFTLALYSSKASFNGNEYRELKRTQVEEAIKVLKEKEFKDPEEDLPTLVKIGQIQEVLGDPQPDWACQSLGKVFKHINSEIPKNLYYLGEAHRLFKCKQLQSVPDTIKASLKDAKALEDINDIYYFYLLQKGAKKYGFEKSEDFKDFLKKKVNDDWNANFKEDWSYNSQTRDKGLTIEGLHIAEMIASQKSDSDKLKGAIEKLLGQAYEDQDTWFIVTKNANEIDNTEINFKLLQVFNSSKGNNLKTETLIKFRNYFYQKAIGAQCIDDFNVALRALNKLSMYPFIHASDSTIINLGDAKAQIKFEFMDLLGGSFPGIKAVKVVLKSPSNSLFDAKSKFQDPQAILSIQSLGDLDIGAYQIIFEVETKEEKFNINASMKVVDQISINDLAYKVESTYQFPSSLDNSLSYGQKVKELEILEGFFFHLSLDASFSSGKQPSQVYLAMKKVDKEKNLFTNIYGSFNMDSQRFQITVDIQNDLDHLNGEYDMFIHVSDSNAKGGVVWNIGKAKVWFKQGMDTGNNLGVKEEYKPMEVIKHIFPPENQESSKNIVFSFVGLGGIGVAFLFYLKQIISLNSNLNKLSFKGVLLLVTVLLILGVFTMFWISVRLITTLWILLAISPIVFLVMNQALVEADCTIEEVKVKNK